ncbi:MAG: hypothetical protein NUV77_09900 [Thermoguttaceae bacterium]|jgi:hypothetical protein|nr:hypothetical protein [Thermoguttaceae bacterium]
MTEWRVTFTCELVEDLHAGSGLGFRGMIDDRHARDSHGRPVLADNALAGLLRDAAEELSALGHPLATRERIGRLFGAEGAHARARLVVRGLRFERKAGEDPLRPVFLAVTSTAREVYSRRPLEHTLRTVEMAAAGLEARGETRFFGDEDDRELLLLCLRRVSSVGAGKTRGAGRLRLRDIRCKEAPSLAAPSAPPGGPCRLRVLLRNLEPLCVAKTGFPGNIIETDTYLPGSALRGAILRALSDRGVSAEDVGRLAAADIRFGNGYFVPEDAIPRDPQGRLRGMENLVAMPLPLTAEEAKATERKTDPAAGPWWAQGKQSDGPWLADREHEWDGLLPEARATHGKPAETSAARFKRVKGEHYLVGPQEGPFDRAWPEVVTLMRNRIPAGRVGRSFDSRRPTADADELQGPGELYSMDALAEEQLFLAEICFDSAEAAKAFWKAGLALFGGDDEHVEQRAWLRVGRGGCPVRVEASAWIDNPALRACPEGIAEFTLTLTSDLIARAADLTFYTTLDTEALAELTGLSPDSLRNVKIDAQASRSEARLVYGFNTAAASRRAAALAIRRGSAFLVTGPEKEVSRLFDHLASLEALGRGLGERQEEGFGRFALNHSAHRRPAVPPERATRRSVDSPLLAEPITADPHRPVREDAIAAAVKAVEELKLLGLCHQKNFPSRSQWQWLRHRAEVAQKAEDLDALFKKLEMHSKKLGGRMWACPCPGGDPLWRAMQIAYSKAGDFDRQRVFLVYFCRWVVRQLDRNRRENKGG